MSSAADGFDPIPSRTRTVDVTVIPQTDAEQAPDAGVSVLGIAVGSSGEVPPVLGLGRDALAAAGFTGKVGQALVLPQPKGTPLVAVGIGEPAELDASALRDAAAAFGRAVPDHGSLTTDLANLPNVPAATAAQAVVEGVLLARYRYEPLKRESPTTAVSAITLTVGSQRIDAARDGARRGLTFARAGMLARDLANTPPAYLTAAKLADCARTVGAGAGLEVDIFERDALAQLGCGGLLGVNAGSAEPPRMVKLSYRPAGHSASVGSTGGLALVGKGIMYDSGGISLKPSDAVHATMKNDMSGAGAILAAMSALTELGCTTPVTGYLMCTDNMPSGTATKLGDVLTMRGGTTVEVLNTDAEGRLVMADALVLAAEEQPDAIVDIATLTGACLRALGAEVAGVFGTDQALVDQLSAAAQATDEPVWQLPLDRRYRSQLDSEIADMTNMGGPNAGATTAALFLAEFVGEVPWAHIDIAGPAQNDAAAAWRPKGCTGFGARLLLEFALDFTSTNAGTNA